MLFRSSENERNEDLNRRFNKNICIVIEDLVPTAEILNTYLPLPAAGEDLNMDHDEEEPQDEDEDVPDIDEIPNTNMELGKTPGGQDNMVTTTDSLPPPAVPGTTPAEAPAEQPMEQTLFDDAPTKVQKLGQ